VLELLLEESGSIFVPNDAHLQASEDGQLSGCLVRGQLHGQGSSCG